MLEVPSFNSVPPAVREGIFLTNLFPLHCLAERKMPGIIVKAR